MFLARMLPAHIADFSAVFPVVFLRLQEKCPPPRLPTAAMVVREMHATVWDVHDVIVADGAKRPRHSHGLEARRCHVQHLSSIKQHVHDMR
jgi:hypothetical protein